jgi:uncharacterized protein YehS (DUF1456 family)
MTPNDALRSLRYILRVNDAKLVEIIELGGYLATHEEVVSYLEHEESPHYQPCPDELLAHFLNGMVIFKRGKDESRPAPPVELPASNNTVLKKIRVAFELKDTDIIALIEKSGVVKVTKAELSAFFRSRGRRNYRECGDQFLRNLLKALGE